MSVTKLTDGQLNAIMIIERVNSSLSVVGCSFIIFTFLYSRAFHKPINRLVFYASVGNIMANIATLISRSALVNVTGALCQFQGFLIQMFMCADALWTLAMACNVYLTFFHKYDADKLRTMEKWYFLACYGVPFIPAIVYVFVTTPNGSHLYGDATLWCWVSKDFDAIRIVTFYAPVWIVIFATFTIYIRAGKEIYKKRKQLRNFSHLPNSTLKNPFTSTKTTEVHVTSEAIEDTDRSIDLGQLDPRPAPPSRPLYCVTVSSNQVGDYYRASPIPSLNYDVKSIPAEQSRYSRPYISMEANNAAWSYTKVAILFFTAMLVTWIPSSANRVYSVINPGYISPPLQFASAFVLPLQGFWNAIIYTTTSWHACRGLFSRSYGSTNSQAMVSSVRFSRTAGVDGLGNRDKSSETESTIELASRPSSRMGN